MPAATWQILLWPGNAQEPWEHLTMPSWGSMPSMVIMYADYDFNDNGLF